MDERASRYACFLLRLLGRELEDRVPLAECVVPEHLAEEVPLPPLVSRPTGQGEAGLQVFRCFAVEIALTIEVGEVVVRAQGRRRQVVFERDLERVFEQRVSLSNPAFRGVERDRLRGERVGEDLREQVALRHVDRGLDP